MASMDGSDREPMLTYSLPEEPTIELLEKPRPRFAST
jgi:hypothetical protein